MNLRDIDETIRVETPTICRCLKLGTPMAISPSVKFSSHLKGVEFM